APSAIVLRQARGLVFSSLPLGFLITVGRAAALLCTSATIINDVLELSLRPFLDTCAQTLLGGLRLSGTVCLLAASGRERALQWVSAEQHPRDHHKQDRHSDRTYDQAIRRWAGGVGDRARLAHPNREHAIPPADACESPVDPGHQPGSRHDCAD